MCIEPPRYIILLTDFITDRSKAYFQRGIMYFLFSCLFLYCFHILCVYMIQYRFSLVWGNSCSFGQPYVFFVSRIFIILILSHSGFVGRTMVLMDPVPGHCLPFILHS